jgi:hypothetical protein
MDTDDPLILADGHVHLYACFDLPRLFDAAFSNFAAVAASRGRNDDFSGALLLTETGREHAFEDLFRSAAPADAATARNASPGWHLVRTSEDISLLACRGSVRLLLVAGRQIVTREGLEVLAIGTDRRFDDGRPVEETIRRIRAVGALPVLPWGVGKWLGRRGRLVKRAVGGSEGAATRPHLGDNSGRPVFWPRPRPFRIAERRGLKVLPGSDPLPLASEAARVGRFGFGLSGALSGERPAADLLRRLDEPGQPVFAYGELERPLRFLRNQIRIRLR